MDPSPEWAFNLLPHSQAQIPNKFDSGQGPAAAAFRARRFGHCGPSRAKVATDTQGAAWALVAT